MKYMSWPPQALGYPSALARHVEAILDLMHEESER